MICNLTMIERLEPRLFLSTTRFAVIGDFGSGSADESKVAHRVASWHPGFVLTVGDNNYLPVSSTAYDTAVGRDYHRYLSSYAGSFGKGSATPRFFPTLGNHDWESNSSQPYTDFFNLSATSATGDERYYDFARGNVHFFALDSDPHEPDGMTASSVQGLWLQRAMATATEPYKVVYFHHPSYSSGPHGGTADMRWPFKEWGANLILNGHDHDYERLNVDGLDYIVNGLGGESQYAEQTPDTHSQKFFTGKFGALRVDATSQTMTVRFVTQAGKTIDRLTIPAPVVPPDAAVSLTVPPEQVIAGRHGSTQVVIENNGVEWRGRLIVLLASTPETTGIVVPILSKAVKLHLKPNAAKTLKLPFRWPTISPGNVELRVSLFQPSDLSTAVTSTFVTLSVP